MAIELKPVGDRIVVKADPPEEKTASGIYIPDQSKEKPNKGTIVAVGEESILKVGDLILYGKYSGTEITYEDEQYLIMRQSDVYATI